MPIFITPATIPVFSITVSGGSGGPATPPKSADPFGSSLSEALRKQDDVIPHPVVRPNTPAEVDDLWASIQSYGKGS